MERLTIPKRVRGLTPREVEQSRREHGDNNLTQKKRKSFLREFLANFGDPIIKILLVALVANVVVSFGDFNWFETVGIALAILISTFVSTISEYGSEAAFEKLQEEAMKTKCRVLRSEGVVELPVGDVVVGDTVLLQPGDRIPADGLIISGELQVDQSPLNGESKEALKKPGGGAGEPGDDFSDPARLFRGCVVVSGSGMMRVTAVGSKTVYGQLAIDVQEESRASPLKMRLAELAQKISRFGYIAAALVAAADLFNSLFIGNGMNWDFILEQVSTPQILFSYLIHAVTLAISVIVVAIPEGLPLMITIVLSSNMKRMLKDNVLVRRLVGIETSGNLNILFTDKTGTLTLGRPKVHFFLSGSGTLTESAAFLRRTELGRLVRLNCQYNTQSVISRTGKGLFGGGKLQAIGGNATERALLEYVMHEVSPGEAIQVLGTVPFTSERKFSSARVGGSVNLTLIKGAPERILPHCTHYYDDNGNRRPFNPARVKKTMDEMTRRAFRLLALASSSAEPDPDEPGKNLTLIGVVGIRDDIRPEAPRAIRDVVGAGIQVVMITGDNAGTAAAIAREVGLIRGDEKDAVFTSDQIRKMSDAELKRKLPNIRVVARAVPSDKSRLVAIAQELGMVAGMTGDGINDAPALKKADVGFAMGSGTEVAKEAGDIVILDNNFLSIAKAILYGRTIFKSIRKFIIFQLTINFCAVAISVIGPFIGINTPITVLQMLWVNMVMDTLAGLAFAGEPPLPEYMKEKPKRRDEPIINRYMYNQILVSGLFTTLLCVVFLKLPAIQLMYRRDGGDEYFMTAFFAMFIFAGVFNSFNARTTRLNILAHIWKNKAFVVIMLLVSAVQLLIIYFGGSILRTTGLSLYELQFVILLALLVIPVDFIRKSLFNSTHRGSAI